MPGSHLVRPGVAVHCVTADIGWRRQPQRLPLGAGGYEIPPGKRIYKFMIQDQTADQTGSNYKTNLWYVDDIYFTAK